MKNTKAKIFSNLIITFNDKKRVVYSFISNNDGTNGFRFNVLGLKGFTRFRKNWKKHQTPKVYTRMELESLGWNYPEKVNTPAFQKAVKKLEYDKVNSYRQFHFSFITIAFEKRSNPIKLSKTFAKARS
tara:strand:- start:112 stop:498 length:387 start_codon:yes stop_codon:yes gene_type:complete